MTPVLPLRIRVTPEVTMDNYELVHAKSAELAYYLEYNDKDPEYRTAANPGQCPSTGARSPGRPARGSLGRPRLRWRPSVCHYPPPSPI